MVSLPPPTTTEIYYDDQWNSVSVRTGETIAITRGVSSEGTRAEPTEASLRVDNAAGDYSPRNPASPLYGKIGRNTPIRHSVSVGAPYLLLPGDTTAALTTPDDASLAVTGDLDVRIEVSVEDYSVSQELAARYPSTATEGSWYFALTSGQPSFRWTPDGTVASGQIAGIFETVPAYAGQRMALRATLDVDNGAGGWTCAFYWAPSIDSDRWQLIGTDTGSGTTSVYDGTSGIHLGTTPGFVGNGLNGKIFAFQLRDGIDGTVAVDVDLARDATMGDTSFADPQGLVWTLSGAATLANEHTRLVGEVPAWPPSRDLSGQDRTVHITPAGIMRRLDAGKKPLESAVLRYIRAASPVDCWPLTDGALAEWGTSIVTGARMTPTITSGTAAVKWGEGSLADWVEPVMLISPATDGYLRGFLPDSAPAASGWSIDMAVSGLVDGSVDCLTADRGEGTDADNRLGWYVALDADANNITVTVSAVGSTSSSSSSLATVASPGIFDGLPHHIRLTVTPLTLTTSWALYVDGVLADDGTYGAVSKAALYVSPGWFQNAVTSNTPALGFITYWDSTGPTAADVYEALQGFPGELAGARFLRLCAEQGVDADVYGPDDGQTALGVQKPARFLDLLASISDADLGYVLERRDARALIYRTRTMLYNQAPAFTLDFADGVIGAPFRPLDDDLLTQNDIVITRDGGGSAQAVLESGRMSVQDPPLGVGRYDVAKTLSLEDDTQPAHHAYWRLRLGTHDGLRYTRIALDLGNPRVYAMVADILRADVGDKIRLTNLPTDHGPDDVDLIIRGYTEETGPDVWRIVFTCEPGGPWTVGVLDHTTYGRGDTGGCGLGADIDADDTSLSLVTTGSQRWVDSATYPSAFPFDVVIGGERMTFTAITGTTINQTATATRSVNGVSKSHTTGAAVRLFQPVPIAL